VDIHNFRTQSCEYPLFVAKKLGISLNGGWKDGDALLAHQKVRDSHYFNCEGYRSDQPVVI